MDPLDTFFWSTVETRICQVCGIEQPVDSFVHRTSRGKRKVRRYCNTCRETYTDVQISNALNAYFSPRWPFDPASIQLPTDHSEDLQDGEIALVGARSEFKTTVSNDIARTLVREHAVKILNPTAIKLVMDRKSLREYVLWRELATCSKCGNQGNHVVRVREKSQGGLRTPQNLTVLCDSCKQGIQLAMVYNVDGTVTPLTHHQEIRNDTAVECYCDISRQGLSNNYGMAVVLSTVDSEEPMVVAKFVSMAQANTVIAEAEAVLWARELCSNVNACVTIYSDVNFKRFIHPRDPRMQSLIRQIASNRTNEQILYLDPTAQEHPLHKLAHQYSRRALRNQHRI